MFYLLHLVTYNLLVLLHLTIKVHSTHMPLWTWECFNERCEPIKATPDTRIQSLTTCNMLCSLLQFWPQPTGYISLSPTAVPIDANSTKLKIISSPSKHVSSHVRQAFEIFQNGLRNIATTFKFQIDEKPLSVQIAVNKSGNKDPRMLIDTDESYTLRLRPNNNGPETLIVDIASNSFCGARHALETLSQLTWYDPYEHSLFIIETAEIHDKPRFHYRGLMLDTAQNFFPVQKLARLIDTMASCKLNTFHWHATNSYSFPLMLKSIPEFTQFILQGYGPVYTLDDVRYITKYARYRGIRVILEVNLPTFVVKPWLDSLTTEHELAYCTHFPSNILRNTLKDIYEEIIELTGVNDVFHIGNDDVYEFCQLKKTNSTKNKDNWLEFMLKSLQSLAIANNGTIPRLTIIRSSRSADQLKFDLKEYMPNIGIQIHNVSWGQSYTSGIGTIISHEDAWDLNNGYGSWLEYSNSLPYNSWQRIYEHRPWSRKGVGLIGGGEATVWSSTLTSDELDSYVWPRAAALGERLWSDRAEGATRLVHARLDVYRSRLVLQGIQASPLWSMWCTQHTLTC